VHLQPRTTAHSRFCCLCHRRSIQEDNVLPNRVSTEYIVFQAVDCHWDRPPVPGEGFPKRKSTKTNLSSTVPPSDIFSVTEYFGVLMLLAVWDRQPIMATNLRSASPPESKVSPVLTSATKLHLAYKGCLAELCVTKLGHLPYH